MNNQRSTSEPVSAAGIIIPEQFDGPPPGQPSRNADNMTPAEEREFFDNLYALRAASGFKTSKHEVVRNLIWACIERGVNSRDRIIGAVHEIGFNAGHVAIILKRETGTDKSLHWWWRDKEGKYRLHC